MKKLILIILGTACVSFAANAQIYGTKTGHIKFYSDGLIEKIEAHNKQVNAALDVTSGNLVFQVLMKSFEFAKALMQEHFNENYVESDKFPNATFVGKVTNISDIRVGKDGIYDAMVEGKLTIHGITQVVKEKGSFESKEGKLLGKAKFNILLSDYNIKIPGAVTKNISNTIEITVDLVLEKLN